MIVALSQEVVIMRGYCIALFLVLLADAHGYGQSTAQEIIDRAIKAQTEKPSDLAKRRVERIVMEGKANFGAEVPTVREIIAEWPNRLRYDYTAKMPQGETRMSMALNSDRAWRYNSDAPLVEFSVSQVDEFRSEAHGRWVATLLPLQSGSFTLTVMPENRLDDEEVQVVKASARYRPDVYLFFSKKTGLLRKVSYRTTENAQVVRKDHLFSDYKKFDGLLLPGKLTDIHNGNRMGEFVVKEYKFADKLPPSLFDKPEQK